MTALLIAKVTLLFAAVLAVTLLATRAAAATRHTILAGAQLAALALPFLATIVPPLAFIEPPRAMIVNAAPAPVIETADAYTPAPPPRRARNPLPVIWLAGCALVAIRKITAYVRAILDCGDASRRSAIAAAKLPPSGILFTDRVDQPSTFGRWILLPAAAKTWAPERLRIVLLHEEAHVARHDTLLALFGDAVCAVYWFHPLAWLVARRARLERERACDDRVLSAGVGATEYATTMLDVARGLARRNAAAMPMAERSQMEQRIRAILDPATRRRSAHGLLAIAAIVVAAPLLAALNGVVPRPRGIEPDLLGDDVASPYSERVEPPAPRRVVDASGPDAALIALLNDAAARPPRTSIDFVPERARWALVHVRDGKLVEPMIDALADSDWRIRAYAAWTLGHSVDRRATGPLTMLLDDSIWRVRAMAANALANLADPSADRALLRRIDDPAWQVRTEVVRYLQTTGAHKPEVAAMRNDRHMAVRAAAN